MRTKLKEARLREKLTQQAMADYLGITLIYYQKIEKGDRTGKFTIWDKLEKLTGIHQSELRVIEPSPETNE